MSLKRPTVPLTKFAYSRAQNNPGRIITFMRQQKAILLSVFAVMTAALGNLSRKQDPAREDPIQPLLQMAKDTPVQSLLQMAKDTPVCRRTSAFTQATSH